jgi:N-acetylneuraminic acid mutarotase
MLLVLVLLATSSLAAVADTWREVTTEFSGPKPSDRFNQAQALSPDGARMVVFGGRAAGWVTFLDDTYTLDFTTKKWTYAGPAEDGGITERFQAMEYVYHAGVHLFGGACYLDAGLPNETLRVYNDLWSYNFTKQQWGVVPTSSTPPARYAGAMEVVGDGAYLFGGKDSCVKNNDCLPHPWKSQDQFNDTWRLDLVSHQWAQVLTPSAPSPRYGFSSFVHKGKMYVFGGRFVSGSTRTTYNDMYRFSPDAGDWEKVVPTTSLVPPDRWTASGVVYGDNFYVFGGSQNSQRWYNDTWEFNLNTFSWSQLDLRQAPSPREGSGSVVLEGMWFLQGGKINNRMTDEIDYGDMWALDLDPVVHSSNSASHSSAATLPLPLFLFITIIATAALTLS